MLFCLRECFCSDVTQQTGDEVNTQIKKIMDKIYALEEELRTLLYEQQNQCSYTMAGKRAKFEKNIRDAHKKLKTSIFYWLLISNPVDLLWLRQC